MILQALVQYYEGLSRQNLVPVPGYSLANISYAIHLSKSGELLGLISLMVDKQRGKKIVSIPKTMRVMEQKKRCSGIAPYLLSDNATYLLGLPKVSKLKEETDLKKEQEGFNEKALKYFEASKTLHLRFLEGIDSEEARAVKRFYENWDPTQIDNNAIIQEKKEALTNANLVFLIDGNKYAHDDVAIDIRWKEALKKPSSDATTMQCLVTGKREEIERLHPNIKGVVGAQSAGASLVSFNSESFISFGKEQGYNAPVGKYAAFAYTSALNYLISQDESRIRLADTTVVFWSETAESVYEKCFTDFINIPEDRSADIQLEMKKIASGMPSDLKDVDLSTEFYILGIAPNAARLSVRFFLKNQFGNFLKNIASHYSRMEIVKPVYEKKGPLVPWKLLQETVNQKMRDKTPSPQMTGATMQAILMDTPYPMALYYGVENRVKAEQGPGKITWRRMAIIKAFILKNSSNDKRKECAVVSLNEETNESAYVLGRLFSVLEEIQEKANPNINATIKDRYFNSACATPAMAFPVLIKLATNHLKKIDNRGAVVNLNIKMGVLMDKLEFDGEKALPKHQNLEEQGIFQLGYYHQTQKRFEKKN